MAYTLVLPFHSNADALVPTIARVRREGRAHGVNETLLCHNGAPLTDAARSVIDGLIGDGVRLLDTTVKGLGAGYKLGIREAKEDFVILSAADLPFGWTDLEAFERAGKPDFAIGSKAHPESRIPGWKPARRVSSFSFWLVRRILLGRGTPGDSQGSLIVRTEIARRLLDELVFDDYLCSLELATLHARTGGRVVEVPIVLENNIGKSSVSILKDGYRMGRDVWGLRKRLRA